MKKEKSKKIDTDEKNLKIDEVKLRKKFKLLNQIVIFLEGILLVPVLMIVIVSGTMVGEKLILGTNEFAKGIILDETIEEEREIEPDDIVKLAEQITGEEMMLDEETDNYKYMVAISAIIVAFIDYMCMLLIVDCLGKMFKTIEEEGKPFTLDNIKNLNKIDKFSVILFFFGTAKISISLMSLIIISAISYIFKYGYRIQQEVDETL